MGATRMACVMRCDRARGVAANRRVAYVCATCGVRGACRCELRPAVALAGAACCGDSLVSVIVNAHVAVSGETMLSWNSICLFSPT